MSIFTADKYTIETLFIKDSKMATAADLQAQIEAIKQQIIALKASGGNGAANQQQLSAAAQRALDALNASNPSDPNYSRLQAEYRAAQDAYNSSGPGYSTDEYSRLRIQQTQLEEQLAKVEQQTALAEEKASTVVSKESNPTSGDQTTTTAPTPQSSAEQNNTTISAEQDPNAVAQAFPIAGNAAGNEGNLAAGGTITTTTDGTPGGTNTNITIPGAPATATNSISAGINGARQQAVAMGSGAKDWRFRMSLAPGANYLYKATPPGILGPLAATDGVIFPYSPQIGVSYTSNYANYDLTHTNFKIYTYKNSSVEQISITGDFTAQDTGEANYLLAVIHFFKSVTKMFYGQDQNPSRGIPPPLVYLSGFGQYQFDRHPVVVTNFTYNLPADVDYINAYPTNNSSAIGGQNMQPFTQQITKWLSPLDRIRQLASKIQPGGLPAAPTFTSSQNINEATRVPTKIQIQLQCLPIVTRNDISNKFSLKEYATGSLLRGSTNGLGGGIW